MKTFKRICIQDFEVRDKSGQIFKVERGREYTTSDVNDAHVIVFSNYWAPVPLNIFAGEQIFTQ